jgi:mannose-6-phosphate isomerase-like protein (cupin superfamily)
MSYRKLFSALALSLLVGCSSVPPTASDDSIAGQDAASAASTPREALIHLSVPQKSSDGASQFKADWSYDLVVAEGWSAHVHVIPPGQFIPAHQHPENDELSWIAEGKGEWFSWVKGRQLPTQTISTGDTLIAPKGAVHGIRNPGPGDLSVVVIHRPSFGQNWYLLPSEMTSEIPSDLIPSGAEFPRGFLSGWTLGDAATQEPTSLPADSLYLVKTGTGTLSFEDNALPLLPGHFVKVPPGLRHRIDSGSGKESNLNYLFIRIPR